MIKNTHFSLLPLAMAFLLVFSSPVWNDVSAQKRKAKGKTITSKVNNKNSSQSIQVSNNGQNFDEAIFMSLLNSYINDCENSNQQANISPLRNYYNSLKKNAKQQMLEQLSEKTADLLQNNKKNDALSIIPLYSSLANSNDEKLPTLLYLKGTIYAERLDSAKVKETINELERLSPPNTEYISALYDNIEKIRNFMPPQMRIGDGIWVAGPMQWDNPDAFGGLLGIKAMTEENEMYAPSIFLGTKYDITADTTTYVIVHDSPLKMVMDGQVSNWGLSNLFSMKSFLSDMTSNLSFQSASDSIYIMWTSERINRNSPEVASFLRDGMSYVSAHVSAEYAQHNEHSFGSSFLAGILTIGGEIFFNSIIDLLFTPTKKMYALEAFLKLENDYTMSGTLRFQYAKVNARGESSLCESRTPIKFHRWMPESGIVFESKIRFDDKELYVHPLTGMTGKDYAKDKSSPYANYKKNASKKKRGVWNNEQYKWVVLYNDSVLNSKGIVDHSLDGKTADIGILFSDVPENVLKKMKMESNTGVYVQDIEKLGAANIAGVKKKDIITAVNGYAINGVAGMTNVINNSRPGDILNLSIIRDKKQLVIPIRVTWL